MQKLSAAAAIAAAKKLSEKRWNFENLLFSINKIKKLKKKIFGIKIFNI